MQTETQTNRIGQAVSEMAGARLIIHALLSDNLIESRDFLKWLKTTGRCDTAFMGVIEDVPMHVLSKLVDDEDGQHRLITLHGGTATTPKLKGNGATNGKPVKIETRILKHAFLPAERDQLHGDLLVALGAQETVAEEFEHVKATWKAKIIEAGARVIILAATLRAGFEMRSTKCVVVFRHKDRKKDYFHEGDTKHETPLLTEDMTEADFQDELL